MDASRRKREDLELINRSRTGDKRAFKMLVERYQKRAFGIAYGMLRIEKMLLMHLKRRLFVSIGTSIDSGDSAFYMVLSNCCKCLH